MSLHLPPPSAADQRSRHPPLLEPAADAVSETSLPIEPPEPGLAPEARPEGALERILRPLRNRRWAFLQALVLVPLLAGVLTNRAEPRYDAAAAMLFGGADADFGGGAASRDPSRVAATNEALVSLGVLAERTARRLGGGVSPAAVRTAIRVDGQGDADLVQVTARTGSPELSARMADAYVDASIELRGEADTAHLRGAIATLRRTLAGLPPERRSGLEGRGVARRIRELRFVASVQTSKAVAVQRATVPVAPSGPSLARNVALGILLGGMLGYALASLLERLDTRLRRVRELEPLFDLPVLARVPRAGRGIDGDASEAALVTSMPAAEAFRGLRTTLRFLAVTRELRSLLVTSPISGDGKSTVARRLATTMAEMGDRVALVEADLRKPGAHAHEGSRHGVSTVLAGGSIDEALIAVPVTGAPGAPGGRSLAVLPTGPLPPNPAELLQSDRMRALVEELEERFDMVVIDSPPLSIVADAMGPARHVSGVLVVAALGHTTRTAALELRRQLSFLARRPLGVVANLAPQADERGRQDD